MAEQVFMIALSPTMEEGTILAWKKKVGDKVAMDEPLCEVETDKASMDYNSSQEGTILTIVRDVGTSAKVGDVIAIIGEPGEDFSSLLTAAPASKPAAAASPGSVSSEVPASAPAAAPAAAQSTAVSDNGRVKSSPLARKIASEKGVDLAQVPGSGPGGRVVKSDVEGFVPASIAASAPASLGASGLDDDRVPVSRKRQTLVKRLGESISQAQHYFLTVSLGMDALLEARERINAKRKEKVGLNAFFVKLLAETLKHHQNVHSSWEGDFIQHHSRIDMGLAVAQSDGLITPVVKDSGSKGVVQIETELKDLIDRARSGKLKPEEFTGATFTISNLGGFGIEEFTSIINPPGSAILAMGATIKTPVVDDNDQVVVRRLMKVTLSCDHRVIDGAVGAAFLTDFKRAVEDPFTLLL